MIRVEKRINLKDGQTLWVAPFNDVHLNTDECDKPRFSTYVSWLTNRLKIGDEVLGIGLGDYNDSLSPSERAAVSSAKGGYGLHETSLKQIDLAAKRMSDHFFRVVRPLKNHFAGLLDGHHFMTFSAFMKPKHLRGASNTEYLCELLNTTYLGTGLGWVTITLNNSFQLDFAVSHGYGGARTAGARIIKRVRMSEVARADYYLMGHDDEKVAREAQILEFKDGKYISREQSFIGTGSFQRGYPLGESGGYVEQLLLPPCGLGTVLVGIELEKRGNRNHWHHFWRSWR